MPKKRPPHEVWFQSIRPAIRNRDRRRCTHCKKFVSLDELMRESDYLSLHAALTPKNRGILDETRLRQMKPSAYLVNTARGALIDERALLPASADDHTRDGDAAGAVPRRARTAASSRNARW